MGHDMETVLRDSQLAALGRLLAGFTHEVKNHLAIINESSGLMGDLIEMGKGKEEETCRKFLRIIATIAERVELANVMVKNLNSFAHRMDMPVSVFSINDVVGEEVNLLQRFARLKGVEVEMRLAESLPSVCSNPSLLQFLVYLLVDASLSRMKKGGRLLLVTQKEGGDVLFLFEAKFVNEDSEARGERDSFPGLPAFVAEKLGISLQEEQGGSHSSYRMVVPAV